MPWDHEIQDTFVQIERRADEPWFSPVKYRVWINERAEVSFFTRRGARRYARKLVARKRGGPKFVEEFYL